MIARCVRRAWLWGEDEYAGRNYSHRKQWVIERLTQLCGIFPIEVCAFAVMSNHYHLVLYVDAQRARTWSKEEVIQRWTALFRAPNLVKRWQSGEALEAAALVVVAKTTVDLATHRFEQFTAHALSGTTARRPAFTAARGNRV